uniref:Uncharacterized protein n=1 Tax=Bionectria ochroleuca TaxID=29856 RepID=A0A8H7K3D0_BIOOC
MRDLRGRTCLHEAIKKQSTISSDSKDTPRLDFLLEIGLDHTLSDHDGNSLLHELAARERERVRHGRKWVLPLWEHLVCTLGLDVNQQNHMGRTPLHIICDVFPEDAERWNDDPGPIDFLLTRMKNINVPDHAGLTALHIASTRTEYCTWKLLEARLNPRAITHEGLTPLHLAARAEKSNIVGMLARSLRKSSSCRGLTPTTRTNAFNDTDNDTKYQNEDINAADGDGLTPLYYAVRSGRPETVMILLRAGADANAGCDLFEACGEFEQENAFLDATSHAYYDPLTQREAKREPLEERAVLSPAEPSNNALSTQDVRRLEEIVQLLVSFGADPSRLGPTCHPSPSDGIVGDCVWQGKAYTASCLIDNVPKSLWVKSGKEAPYSGFLSISAAAYDPSLASSKSFPQIMAGRQSRRNFQLFLKQRQYTLVKELAKRGARFLPNPRDEFHFSHFALLIQHGFSLLVKRIGKIEAERALGQGDWHAFGDSSKAGLWCAHRPADEAQSEGKVIYGYKSDFESMPKPFLLEAVQRELPNITIVRSLVEDFRVDVNERTWGHDYTEHERQLAYDQSALHYVAEGFHWWHVHLAMKYLLKVPEIDINFRVKGGLTPLHVAVGGRTVIGKLRPHAYDAAKRLLNAGADIQAVTRIGRGCLSLAIHDVQMIRLLIKHGAIISPDDVVSAIEAGQVDALNELLNAKYTNDREGLDLDLDPALRTAGMLFMKSNPDDQDDIWRPTVDNEIAIEMIKILIEHGANPLSNYIYCPGQGFDIPRPRWRPHLHFKKGVPHTCANPSHREVTLLHELIREVGDFQIQPFLIPGLDVNYRDPQGRTILHVACGRVDLIEKPLDLPKDSATAGDEGGGEGQTLFQHLVGLGADINVRDQLGQNILVSLIKSTSWSKPSPRWRDTLEAILCLAPELVHDADARGDTPLLHAVRMSISPAADTETARRLLLAGASPLVTDSRGEGVLHILAEDLGTAGLRDLFRDLVNRGADINGRNMTGETPLFKFARRSPQDSDYISDPDYGKRKVRGDEYEDPREQGAIALLQELGANFFARDNEGRGLLHIAAAKGGDVVRFQELMAVGLDPMMENNVQQTAIDAAAAFSNNAVLEIFKKKARR